MPNVKKTARKPARKVAHIEPEEELHQSQEVGPEPVAPVVPTADGWYQASNKDGERVLVSVSNGGARFTVHHAAGGCRDIPAEYVAQGYFSDWTQVI